MEKDDAVYLKHIHDFAILAVGYVSSVSREEYDLDVISKLAGVTV